MIRELLRVTLLARENSVLTTGETLTAAVGGLVGGAAGVYLIWLWDGRYPGSLARLLDPGAT